MQEGDMKTWWRMWLVATMLALGGASAWAGIADDVRESLKHGGDPNAWVKQEFGFRTHPLHLVASAGGKAEDRVEAARLLIEAGADVNGRDDSGNTPLHKAVGALNPKVAELLIRHGAKVNARNKAGETPIFRLASAASHLHYGNPSEKERKTMSRDMRTLVALLSRYSADLDARNRKGETPLVHLAGTATAEILGALLDHGARVDVADDKGEQALDKAIFTNDAAAVRQLMVHGARASVGQVVHAIERRKDAEMVLALVEGGAELNGTDRVGDSPLCAAILEASMNPEARRKWTPVIQAMLARGADPKSPCALGSTAMGLAMNDPELSRLFQSERSAVSSKEMKDPSQSEQPHQTGETDKEGEKESPVERGATDVVKAFFQAVDQSMELEETATAAARIETLSGRDAIATRIRTLERYAGLNRKVLQLYEQGDRNASQRTSEAGGDKEAAEAAARVYRKTMKEPYMIALADRARANAEWAELTLRAYRLLEQNPDKWRFGRAGEKHLVITDRGFAKQMGEISGRMKEAGARAREANKRVRRLESAGG
ncbi:MAG: ankyrin repeat domain-containing protein [Gammaproteobacteria bacterium]|nr:MAG: ankyrin repeat domain-containing protein [Gammaproteobacteria bacterium]